MSKSMNQCEYAYLLPIDATSVERRVKEFLDVQKVNAINIKVYREMRSKQKESKALRAALDQRKSNNASPGNSPSFLLRRQ